MPRRRDPLLYDLIFLPWWVSVILAVGAYIGLAFVLPASICPGDSCAASASPQHIIPRQFASLSSILAPYIAVLLLVPAPISAFRDWKKRKLLDRQEGIESIRLLDWRKFEQLLGEYYRRKGFRVRENPHGGADGGVDLWLENDDGLHLVQCKQWRARKVGVEIVRELYGVMAAEGAAGGSVVNSGSFTEAARSFARGKPIDLIGGEALEQMIAEVRQAGAGSQQASRKNQSAPQPAPQPAPQSAPKAEPAGERMSCPRCGASLALRKAGKGRRAGSEFYGCSSFPRCRYTRDA